MKYIKLFNAHINYNEYINSEDKSLPNLSYCELEGDLHLNPIIDYSTKYFTFEVVESGTITLKASNANVTKTISYSTDDGTTWTEITTTTTAQELSGTLNVGDKVLVKGINASYGTSSYYNQFGGTAKVKVYGNIMSLISSDDFVNSDTLSATNTFYRLFYNWSNLLSAENLVLPATTLIYGCYSSMFEGCTSLVNAPELPATTLADGCYEYMFEGCTSLNYIKAMFITTPSSTYTSNWVQNVSSSGTFVKNSAAQWDVTGVNGIPSGWTVETANA